MRRPRILLLSVVLALLVLWGWLVLRSTPKPLGMPTRANFERVQEGMTANEVLASLGPDGNHTTRQASFQVGDKPRRWWNEDDADITIEFTPTDGPPEAWQVRGKWYNRRESFRDRLRRWFPWCEGAFGSS